MNVLNRSSFTASTETSLRPRRPQLRWTLGWRAVCLVAGDRDPSIPKMKYIVGIGDVIFPRFWEPRHQESNPSRPRADIA